MSHTHKCGLDADGYDPHKGCGHEWKHDEPTLLTPAAEYNRRHNCPNCGKGPWLYKHTSDAPSTIIALIDMLDELEGRIYGGKDHR